MSADFFKTSRLVAKQFWESRAFFENSCENAREQLRERRGECLTVDSPNNSTSSNPNVLSLNLVLLVESVVPRKNALVRHRRSHCLHHTHPFARAVRLRKKKQTRPHSLQHVPPRQAELTQGRLSESFQRDKCTCDEKKRRRNRGINASCLCCDTPKA